MSGCDTHRIDAIELLESVNHEEGQELPAKTGIRKKLPGLFGFNSKGTDPLCLHVLLFSVVFIRAMEPH